MSQTSSRLLELLSLLQGRRDWPGNELADRREVSGRTIRRDMERLRQLGCPVASATHCRDTECLRFGYRSRDGTATRRDVQPHSLVNHGRRWYLVAWDIGREDWRTFRVDRLAKPASTGRRFAPRGLPAKDAAAYV